VKSVIVDENRKVFVKEVKVPELMANGISMKQKENAIAVLLRY